MMPEDRILLPETIHFSDLKIDETVYLVTFKNGDNPFFTKNPNHSLITDGCVVFDIKIMNIYDVEKTFKLIKRSNK
jgi:hypothetical protein